MSKKKIDLASREMKRLVNLAVGRNFLKTVTEPLTNSDSILKVKAGVSHAAGLIDEMLTLKVNDRVNTSELKARIPKRNKRVITLQLTTVGKDARVCRVVDAGLGMNASELEAKFGTYAAAKAKGQKTRSLFGRGALDVLAYHENSVIYSVQNGSLSRCAIYWESSPVELVCEVDELGKVSNKILQKYDLPPEITSAGTVVEFRLKEGTHIPVEDQIIAKLSCFYMLRLIAADPNARVIVERRRTDGIHTDDLKYDFPIGTVIWRGDDALELESLGTLPVSIMVARSDVQLESDPDNIERRENGLLFVDENDAVLDLTLLPDYDRNPFLKHIYGVVRITGIRTVLEARLEDDEAEAVLTTNRDGFDRKSDITRKLFALIANLRILGVDDPPVLEPPTDIEFTASRYAGDPNRPSNNAALLVNLKAFTGYPEVTFWLEESVGSVRLGDGVTRLDIKVTSEHRIDEGDVARIPVPFKATGWGQRAVLCAKAKRSDGKVAHAKCKIRFEHQTGDQKFSNLHYEDLDRAVLGDVASDKLYINSGYALHKQIFGETEDDFNARLETDLIAQVRAAAILVETAVYHTATTRWQAGGKKGLHIDSDDPIGTLRPYLDESRIKLEPRLFKALAPEVGSGPKN